MKLIKDLNDFEINRICSKYKRKNCEGCPLHRYNMTIDAFICMGKYVEIFNELEDAVEEFPVPEE